MTVQAQKRENEIMVVVMMPALESRPAYFRDERLQGSKSLSQGPRASARMSQGRKHHSRQRHLAEKSARTRIVFGSNQHRIT
jgi:hypothetical protein